MNIIDLSTNLESTYNPRKLRNTLKTILLILLPLLVILSIFLYPNATLLLSIVAMLVSLTFAVYSIIQMHKGKPDTYKRIFQETSIFIITLLFIVVLGGLAGTFMNDYVSSLYGATIGLMCGLVVAFTVGYLGRKGIAKFRF